MYAAGADIEVEAYTRADKRVNADMVTMEPLTLSQMIDKMEKLGESLGWRKFRICVGDLWTQWHYTGQ